MARAPAEGPNKHSHCLHKFKTFRVCSSWALHLAFVEPSRMGEQQNLHPSQLAQLGMQLVMAAHQKPSAPRRTAENFESYVCGPHHMNIKNKGGSAWNTKKQPFEKWVVRLCPVFSLKLCSSTKTAKNIPRIPSNSYWNATIEYEEAAIEYQETSMEHPVIFENVSIEYHETSMEHCKSINK